MKKKKLLIPVIARLVTVLVLSGVSYAYFSAKIKENNKAETVLKSNELNLIFIFHYYTPLLNFIIKIRKFLD